MASQMDCCIEGIEVVDHGGRVPLTATPMISPASLIRFTEYRSAGPRFHQPPTGDLAFVMVCRPHKFRFDQLEALTANDQRLALIAPSHSCTLQIDEQSIVLVGLVQPSIVHTLLGTSYPADITTALAPLSNQLQYDPLATGLLTSIWKHREPSTAIERSHLSGALVALLSHVLLNAGPITAHSTSAPLTPVRLKRVEEFVRNNLHNPLEISDLAKVAGLSVRHFGRAFVQRMGETPHRWLMRLRVEYAKPLLSIQRNSLADIALRCGFAGQSHFTTVFKKIVGTTPNRWRMATRAHDHHCSLKRGPTLDRDLAT